MNIKLSIVLAIALALPMIFGCGPNPEQKGSVITIQDFDKIRIKKLCIEGHWYYYTAGECKGGIAPVLTDDGKPVKCE